MKLNTACKLAGIVAAISSWSSSFAQDVPVTARKYGQQSIAQVAVGSNAPVAVSDLKMKFEYHGYGGYKPSDYSATEAIPLETGINVDFAKTDVVTFVPKPVEHRAKDHKWIETVVDVELKLVTGATIKQQLKPPESARVYLVGKTEFGDFKYLLNERRSSTVTVTFQK